MASYSNGDSQNVKRFVHSPSAAMYTRAESQGRRIPPLALLRPINGSKNLVLFRKAELLELGEHECAVDAHFKGNTAALDESGFNTVLIFDGILQTCSIRQVESLSAIFNRNVHCGTPLQAVMRRNI